MKPYVHSNFERIKDDNYQTIDPRCVKALYQSKDLHGWIADCCSKNGSGIIDELKKIGFSTIEMTDAFAPTSATWIVSNPPYDRKIVDNIIWAQIERLSDGLHGVAMLLRNNFDFAKSRYKMFTHKYYTAQIHMMFRPWWVEERKAQPIHNYVWHIWTVRNHITPPSVIYWKES